MGFQKSFDYTPGGTLPNSYHGIFYHRFTKYGAWKEAKTFVTIFDGGQSIIDFFSVRISSDLTLSVVDRSRGPSGDTFPIGASDFEIVNQKKRINVKLMIIIAKMISTFSSLLDIGTQHLPHGALQSFFPKHEKYF